MKWPILLLLAIVLVVGLVTLVPTGKSVAKSVTEEREQAPNPDIPEAPRANAEESDTVIIETLPEKVEELVLLEIGHASERVIYQGRVHAVSQHGEYTMLTSAVEGESVAFVHRGQCQHLSLGLQCTPFAKLGAAWSDNLVLAPHFMGKANRLLGALFEISFESETKVERTLLGDADDAHWTVKDWGDMLVSTPSHFMVAKSSDNMSRVDIYARGPKNVCVQKLTSQLGNRALGDRMVLSGDGQTLWLSDKIDDRGQLTLIKCVRNSATGASGDDAIPWRVAARLVVALRGKSLTAFQLYTNHDASELLVSEPKFARLIRKTMKTQTEWTITAMSCVYDMTTNVWWILTPDHVLKLEAQQKYALTRPVTALEAKLLMKANGQLMIVDFANGRVAELTLTDP